MVTLDIKHQINRISKMHFKPYIFHGFISGGLDSSTVCVIPMEIPPGSIQATGSWSHFNVTWQPSVEVNHGEVSYEVSVEAEYMMKNILVIMF